MPAAAQNISIHNISGSVIDDDNGEPLPIAAVQVLSLPDSSQVKGVVTDNDGNFSAQQLKNGSYVLRVSYIGYRTHEAPLNITGKSQRNVELPVIRMETDSKMLQQVSITADVPKVQAVKDTIMFNSAAYRLSETASIKELIKKLPGVEMDSDGNITVNGKAVSQILINGREYLGEDITTLLENLPANMIDRLKTYEKKSDLARITGIDDGEEQTVFDLQTKGEMKGGLLNTYDIAYGSDYGKHNLYNGQVMINRFTDHNQFTLYGTANNVIDQDVGTGAHQWGNRGMNTNQRLSASYVYTNDEIEFNANFGINHNANDYGEKRNSENFFGNSSSFSNSQFEYDNSSKGYNGNFYIEWRPDTMTNIIARPYFNRNSSDNSSKSLSATYNSNPYDYMDDPLYDMTESDTTGFGRIFVNRNTGQSKGENGSGSFGGSIQANRRLNNEGRNVTLRLSADMSENTSDSWSYNTTRYYTYGDSTNLRNRFTTSPTERNNYSAQLIYSEPIFTKMFLQFSYRLNYSWNETDRRTYSFDDSGLGFMQRPDDYENCLDTMLSKYSSYTTLRHDIQASLRINREKLRMNAGFRLQPTRTQLEYTTQGKHYSPTQNIININPTFDFRYMFTDDTDIRLRANGSSSQPSMTDLLDITDNTNPLYITQGNPDLKPSFTTNFNFDFHTYNADKQASFMTHMNFRTTSNSISNRVEYNPLTGGQTTRPANINGNWNVGGHMGGNVTLPDQRYTVNLFTNLQYSNQVAFLFQDMQTLKMTTKSLNPGAHLGASFRDEKLEITINGGANRNHSRNDMRPASNMDTWTFNWGSSGNVTLPWDIRVAYDLYDDSRRGYEDDTYNTDEIILNAELQKAFLKNKAAVLSVQFFDILGQRKSYSRSISATSRNNAEYDVINQYFMLHFTYRLNIVNGKLIQEDEEDDRRDRRGGPGGPGGRGDNYRGGGGGNYRGGGGGNRRW